MIPYGGSWKFCPLKFLYEADLQRGAIGDHPMIPYGGMIPYGRGVRLTFLPFSGYARREWPPQRSSANANIDNADRVGDRA